MTSHYDVSIVIPTFRRQNLIKNLIDRCFAQTGLDELTIEIVVVDNCPQQSAREVMSGLVETYGAKLIYAIEEHSGVSHARNTGVRLSRGHMVVFIDDDEVPAEDWLAHLVKAQKDYSADIVMGPVYPILSVKVDQLDNFYTQSFTHHSDCKTGTPIMPRSPLSRFFGDQYCYRTMATNNVLLVKDRCILSDQPFEPSLGRTGGEDAVFFWDLYFAKRTFVWCLEAKVSETIPAERLKLPYIVGRYFHGGQCLSFCCYMMKPKRYPRLIQSMIYGGVQFFTSGVLAAVYWPFNKERAVAATCTAVGGLGKLLWMNPFRYRAYGLPAS